ncbi:class I SAM-dependent methyltransferase [Glycomyces buryatensis]|uniref:Class I SAM-dependent methyltransferase n=1 Tax=Glycomyces buryatensis TaxID=2570927 RepID=A0A4S8Q0L3_9ACTN|nr:class I SAM-dependent methyltransferase [Glycomyces buryatensis]THV37627.1 class I SAM-dependent methyltransferase [Glycomyces buryatensis]
MSDEELKEIVQSGYDTVSYAYRDDEDAPPQYRPWIEQLLHEHPPGTEVLDIGCGCGVPMSKSLAESGHAVTGIDISEVQIARARRLVPSARFFCGDATAFPFPDRSFDLILCLYTLWHVPLPNQESFIGRMSRWLRPGGALLATVAVSEWEGVKDGWLEGGSRMWWGHRDLDTYRTWFDAAGFDIESDEFISLGRGKQQALWTRRR